MTIAQAIFFGLWLVAVAVATDDVSKVNGAGLAVIIGVAVCHVVPRLISAIKAWLA